MVIKSYLGAVCHGDAGYGIVFLDFPGCVSAGDSLSEVLAMGREALEGHIGVMRDYGDPVPEPSEYSLDDVDDWLNDPQDDEEPEPWVGLFPIEVTIQNEHGDVRVALPRGLIRDLDQAAPDARQFIIDATRRELDRLKKSA